jgi:putative ABC transport system permease protein
MRLVDIIWLSLSGLREQKLRTLLTTLGVLFGSFVLAFSLSLRRGVQETIVREYSRYAGLRQIQVQQSYENKPDAKEEEQPAVQGDVSAERQARLRHEISRRIDRAESAVPVNLSAETLRRLQQLPHVKEVNPDVTINGKAGLENKVEDVFIHSAPVDDEQLRKRLLAGDLPDSSDSKSAVVSEYLLYRLGVVDDAAIQAVLGRPLRLEYRVGSDKSSALLMLLSFTRLTTAEKNFLRKALQTPGSSSSAANTTFSKTFTIVGVLRSAAKGDPRPAYLHWWIDDVDVVLPVRAAADWFFEAPSNQKVGVGSAIVEVDDIDAVKETVAEVRKLGLRTTSLVELIEREQFTYQLMFGVMTCIAGVALLVAALGIVNTMLMSVLERTREIGVMKAVGARNRHIMTVFLVEGFLIGLTGGILGLVVAWAVSIPSNSWIHSMISERVNVNLSESIYVWPAWILVGAPLFTCAVTTCAAVFPARRAARVNPITALRHE